MEIDGISGLRETSNLRIRGVKRSLEDDLRFIQDGDNFLNKRIRVTDTLQNTFEGFEDKVQDIWLSWKTASILGGGGGGLLPENAMILVVSLMDNNFAHGYLHGTLRAEALRSS